MKIQRQRILLVVLLLMLCTSIGSNIWLYQRSSEYYLELNSTRLDPFGLRSYQSGSGGLPEQSSARRVVFFGVISCI